ncbi:MAG: L,D-transpeptidase family protein [Planctomycetota bacterium]
MSLPSQQRSFGSRVSGSRRQGGGPARLIIGAIALVAVVGLGMLAFGGGGGGDDTAQEDHVSPDLRAQAADSLREPAPTPADDVALVEDDGFVETGVLTPTRSSYQEPQTARPNVPSGALVATHRDRPATSEQTRPERTQPAPAPRPEFAGDIAGIMDQAREHLQNNDLVAARATLNRAFTLPDVTPAQLAVVRDDMTSLNEELFFGTRVYEGDPLAARYTIQPGDSLEDITSDLGLACDWRLIQRINRIANPDRIRSGQTIKVVQGPFHAVVDKSDYRLDLFAGPPGSRDQLMYIRSYPVGLGADDSTPVGEFVVRPDSKLINPFWQNPRTGEQFQPDDPANPIGEYWLGLEGIGDAATIEGYGIHGTIDPDSIGAQDSMGCIRLDDVAVATVYEMLEEQVSQVSIVP